MMMVLQSDERWSCKSLSLSLSLFFMNEIKAFSFTLLTPSPPIPPPHSTIIERKDKNVATTPCSPKKYVYNASLSLGINKRDIEGWWDKKKNKKWEYNVRKKKKTKKSSSFEFSYLSLNFSSSSFYSLNVLWLYFQEEIKGGHRKKERGEREV